MNIIYYYRNSFLCVSVIFCIVQKQIATHKKDKLFGANPFYKLEDECDELLPYPSSSSSSTKEPASSFPIRENDNNNSGRDEKTLFSSSCYYNQLHWQ